MKTISSLQERRKDERYQVISGGFVVLLPREYFPKLGQMIDISLGGLSFQYHTGNNISLELFNKVDVYFSGDGLCLENIPVELVWDLDIAKDDPYYKASIKRYGVRFGGINEGDVNQLNQFIQRYTLPVGLPA